MRRVRQGYLYVAVLFTTLIVAATVSVSLSISTASLRSENNRNHRVQALQLAESEIHRLAAGMRTSAQWRTDFTNDQFSTWRDWTIEPATPGLVREVRHRYADDDGVLDDNMMDAVHLTVHARVGDTESTVTVTLQSDPEPLDLLGYSLTCTDDLRFESDGTLATERPVQVIDNCRTNSSGLLATPDLQCSGTVEMTLRGNSSAAAVTVPTYDVLARYSPTATEISITSLPEFGGERFIQDVVLTPTANPYGSANAAGIYQINASGQIIRIENSRLDAILVISGATEVILSGGLTWNYPFAPEAILVCDSNLTIENLESSLSESDRSTNFNPTGSPYRETLTNSTMTDTYPTELRGFVYTSQDIVIEPLIDNAILPVTGSIMGRDVRIDGHVSVRQLDEWIDTPPLGFSNQIPMRFTRGTFRRIPSPP